jgi:hypothetical protein
MTDYNKEIEELAKSITKFTFEFDFAEVLNKMELREVPKNVLDTLGKEKIRENFENKVFYMRLPDGKVIDVVSFSNFIQKDNIKAVSVIRFNFQYVRWEITEDLTTPQIKKYIRSQLNNVKDLNELKKVSVLKELENKEIVGKIADIQIETSESIENGKFYIPSTFSKEQAYKQISETISELQKEQSEFIEKRIKRDKKHACGYGVFILFVSILWFVNYLYSDFLPTIWSSIIAFTLFIAGFVIVRFINHTYIQSAFCPKKGKIKYQKEFSNSNS